MSHQEWTGVDRRMKTDAREALLEMALQGMTLLPGEARRMGLFTQELLVAYEQLKQDHLPHACQNEHPLVRYKGSSAEGDEPCPVCYARDMRNPAQ